MGGGGSGTIFFARCNLRCVYCQNADISQADAGDEVSADELAEVMLRVQEMGCENVNLVSPTHVTPQILDALDRAAARGLRVPLVWNTGTYERLETLRLLDGVVDVYLPDTKYADAEVARRFSGIDGYPDTMRAALREMHRQVGDLITDERGVAVRGLMVRHLVLPGGLAGTAETMRFIAGELSPDTFVNVMGQYRPAYRARKHAELCRSVSAGEVSDARRLRPRGRPAPGGELMMARVVMVQGTTSHAGKSVLAAALCRMYARRGFRVAPFKAQNMALNSFVTPDGGELGRSQAYQARAAGVDPHVDMNPVLLKPSSDATSQVIVLGRPVRHMTVPEYHAYQAEVWPAVTTAFERLRAANDLIVIEGAGSPAEINLRGQDIVNMRVALHARCPVLLVGDIDRGGVFAALVGHMELFAPEERELVAAFVINKFRGDASQLASGIDALWREHRRAHPRRGADARGLARGRRGCAGHRGPRPRGTDRRAGPDRGGPPALHQQLHGLRCGRRRTGRERALRDDAGGARGRRGDRAARHQEHDRRPDVAAPVGTGGGGAGRGRRRHAGDRRVRRLPDAGPPHPRSRTGGSGRAGDAGARPPRRRDDLRPPRSAPCVSRVRCWGSPHPRPTAPRRRSPARSVPPARLCAATRSTWVARRLGSDATPLLRLRGADGAQRDDGAVSAAGSVCGTYVHGLFDHPALRAAFLDRLRAGLGLPARQSATPPADDDIDRLADHIEAHLDHDLLASIVGL